MKPLIKKVEDWRHYLDFNKPVKVYKNLRTGTWSIMQDNIVRFHSHFISLKNVTFKVNEKTRQRVIRKQKKYVHAFVCGEVIHPQFLPDKHEGVKYLDVTYNPYKNESFVIRDTGESILTADYVDMWTEAPEAPVWAIIKE